MKEKIAFICIHNSARSQIAEELLRKYAGDRYECLSAGLKPSKINPLVAEVFNGRGSYQYLLKKKTIFIEDLLKSGNLFDYIITVCDEGSKKQCLVVHGDTKKIHWNFSDPSNFTGSDREKKQ